MMNVTDPIIQWSTALAVLDVDGARRRLDDLCRRHQPPREKAVAVIPAFIKHFRLAGTDRRRVSPSAARARRKEIMTAVHGSTVILLIVVGVIGFLILLLGPIAEWATLGANQLAGKDESDAVNTTRQILLTAAGGTAVLIGLGFTARTYYLSKRGQFTDRYTKAIAQLASEKITERLGGIYALEHLMRESASDHTLQSLQSLRHSSARELLPIRRTPTQPRWPRKTPGQGRRPTSRQPSPYWPVGQADRNLTTSIFPAPTCAELT